MLDVFETATNGRPWNYFTKAQRKSITQWKDYATVRCTYITFNVSLHNHTNPCSMFEISCVPQISPHTHLNWYPEFPVTLPLNVSCYMHMTCT